jgi:predicted  nucleic acid-binding Zn-ribbon protein
VNPQFHDEFAALVALFYSGELTDEEWALLQVHMAYCNSCRNTFEEQQHIHSEVIPAMAASAAAEAHGAPVESDRGFADAEARLFDRLTIDRPNSSSVEVEPAAPRRSSRPLWIALLAACALAALSLVTVHFVRNEPRRVARATQQLPAIASLKTGDSTQDAGLRTSLKESQKEVARLQAELQTLQQRPKTSSSAVSALQRQLEDERAQRQQMLAERDALSQHLSAAQAKVQTLQDELTTAQTSDSKQTAQLVALETQVRDLNASLEDSKLAIHNKDRMLALDQDFLSHDRDIRDVIGARNLYIADIFDTTESGKAAKPFGRLFYTKDRSLVFYGFDLDKQPGLKQSVAFQVWGSGTDRPPVSLGLLYQDDSHKRWVLRCNDASTLERLNMVFVTVEPPGGSHKPTGRQLLRAYLQIHPNHP